MNSSRNISWPHPVLGNSDDIDGAFKVDISCKIESEKLYVKSESIEVSNEYFQKLIHEGNAAFIFKMTCNSTLWMRQFKGKLDEAIDCSLLSKRVDIEILIVAMQDIGNYGHSSFHEDTKLGENRGIFNVESGSVIGDAGSISINLDEEFRRGLSGIIQFEEVSSEEPISIDVEDTKILVKYPNDPSSQNIITTFTSGKRQFVNVFLNLFIVPAFTEAFSYLIEAQREGKYEEIIDSWDWARFIHENISAPISGQQNALELAQLFLQEVIQRNSGQSEPIPIYRAFNEIFK
jgi:hypothetical protein